MEAMERRGKLAAIAAIMFIVFWSQCKGVEGQRNNTKMAYVCPPNFIRLGHSCYYFSEEKATWKDALFACSDHKSNLTVPARWEDRNLRKYLIQPKVEKASRWIGGFYDSEAAAWRWGGDLRKMQYQSFSKMKRMTPKELEFHCIAMMPELLYRWSPQPCFEARHYICQTRLQKIPKTKIKEMRRRYQRTGKINEITAPSSSREDNDPMMVNDVAANPVSNSKSYNVRPKQNHPRSSPKRFGQRRKMIQNPKAYDLRPNELKMRSRSSVRRRLKRPFPGYTWNRRDPEGSFRRNAEILLAGHTGLTPQQVNAHLARLRHLRDKQIARRKRLGEDDWLENEPRQALAQTHAITYTVDNNISALHPKTIVEEFNMDFPHQPVVLTKSNRSTD